MVIIFSLRCLIYLCVTWWRLDHHSPVRSLWRLRTDETTVAVSASHQTAPCTCLCACVCVDGGAVAGRRLRQAARVRQLRAAADGAGGRRAGDPTDALPDATLRRHGGGRLAGPLPPLQSQPVADTQQHVQLGRRKWSARTASVWCVHTDWHRGVGPARTRRLANFRNSRVSR